MPLQLGKRSFLASWSFCSASRRFVESGPGSSVYLMVWRRILERCRAPDQRPASAAYGRRGALRRFAFSWSEPIPRCALRRSASALRRLARTFLQMRIALFRAISAFFSNGESVAPIVGRGAGTGADLAPIGLRFDNRRFELLVLHRNTL